MKKAIFIFISGLVLSSFSVKKFNADKGFNLKAFEKSLCLIPSGYYIKNTDAVMTPGKAPVKTNVDTFYMSNHEVTNAEYLAFVMDAKEKDPALYFQILPDTLVWKNVISYNEPYVTYYFRHQAYSDYPVVGIRHEQAEAYCKWLTNKYLGEPKRKFRNASFRLPTINEWTYAANGGLDQPMFPWHGLYMQNKDGAWLANFTIVDQQDIAYTTYQVQGKDGNVESKKLLVAIPGHGVGTYFYTAPVMTHVHNDYGLYNMAGNVEEYVAEKGITKGGSWFDTGYYLRNSVEEKYDSLHNTSAERGFRIMMEIGK